MISLNLALAYLCTRHFSTILYTTKIGSTMKTMIGMAIKSPNMPRQNPNENPNTGSGTPMFAVDGALGAIVLSTGVFGGVAASFFVRGRKGKYAAMGRG